MTADSLIVSDISLRPLPTNEAAMNCCLAVPEWSLGALRCILAIRAAPHGGI
ncbi:MAG: hypothetical protein P4L96_12880 [Rhodoferax sp.]|nr:hypothetical protein [Rhodoferax sp.]